MHYEIFKYLDSRDLLEVRITKLGGFQLTSNKLLRSRITNYLDIKPILHLNADRAENIHNLRVFFEQIGQNKIVFEEKFMHNTEFLDLIELQKLSKLIIYSNIEKNNLSGNEVHYLCELFKYIPELTILNLGNSILII